MRILEAEQHLSLSAVSMLDELFLAAASTLPSSQAAWASATCATRLQAAH